MITGNKLLAVILQLLAVSSFLCNKNNPNMLHELFLDHYVNAASKIFSWFTCQQRSLDNREFTIF